MEVDTIPTNQQYTDRVIYAIGQWLEAHGMTGDEWRDCLNYALTQGEKPPEEQTPPTPPQK